MISGEILPLVDEMARYRYKQIRTAPSNKREITSGINCLGLYYVLPALVTIYCSCFYRPTFIRTEFLGIEDHSQRVEEGGWSLRFRKRALVEGFCVHPVFA